MLMVFHPHLKIGFPGKDPSQFHAIYIKMSITQNYLRICLIQLKYCIAQLILLQHQGMGFFDSPLKMSTHSPQHCIQNNNISVLMEKH